MRQEAPAQQAQQKQAAPREQDLDPKLRSWMSKNESWFNKDAVMTGGVKAIHDKFVGVEDYDPTSDEYYAEIDRRMRKEFPHKFQEQRQNAQTVAPASAGRSVKSGRKKTVELTPGQVAFAKKMNIPLERYAKEVAKLDSKEECIMVDRASRDSQTREKTARVEAWRPPSTLEAPEAPVGYKHRWIRESVMEYDDKNNVHKRRREGWELARGGKITLISMHLSLTKEKTLA